MFKVGDKVVCVDDILGSVPITNYSEWVMENKIYTIREILEEPNFPGALGVCLKEIQGCINEEFNVEYGFRIDRFRKLEPPREEIVENSRVLQEIY